MNNIRSFFVLFSILIINPVFAQKVHHYRPSTTIANCFVSVDSKLLVGTSRGVFISIDDGNSWKPVNNGLQHGDSIYNITHLFTINNSIFAATFNNGIFCSPINDDFLWVPTNVHKDSVNSLCVLGLSGNGNNLFSIIKVVEPRVIGSPNNYNKLFISDDFGASWTLSSLQDKYVSCLFVNNSIVFAGTSSRGIYRSLDNGLTWTESNRGLPIGPAFGGTYPTVNGFACNGNNLFVAVGTDVYSSSDNGASWKSVGLAEYTKNRSDKSFLEKSSYFQTDKAWPIFTYYNYLYANSFGLVVSKDNGLSWSQCNGIIAHLFIVCGNNIIASDNLNVYRSADSGTSWIKVSDFVDSIQENENILSAKEDSINSLKEETLNNACECNKTLNILAEQLAFENRITSESGYANPARKRELISGRMYSKEQLLKFQSAYFKVAKTNWSPKLCINSNTDDSINLSVEEILENICRNSTSLNITYKELARENRTAAASVYVDVSNKRKLIATKIYLSDILAKDKAKYLKMTKKNWTPTLCKEYNENE